MVGSRSPNNTYMIMTLFSKKGIFDEEKVSRDFQSLSNQSKIFNGDISFSALNGANIDAVQTRKFRKPSLRITAKGAAISNVTADDFSYTHIPKIARVAGGFYGMNEKV
jgi:hypothetical protein